MNSFARMSRLCGLVMALALVPVSPHLALAKPARAPRALDFVCPPPARPNDFQIMIVVDGTFARSLNYQKAPHVGRLLKFQCYVAIGHDFSHEWVYIQYGLNRAWVHGSEFRAKDGADMGALKSLVPADLTGPEPLNMRLAGVPVVSKAVKELYKKAVKAGRARDIVSVVGDCNSEPPVYFGRFALGQMNLVNYPELKSTVKFFAPAFARTSQAVNGGFSSAMAFDSAWTDPAVCGLDGPVACEINTANPAILILAVGTGDTFTWQTFEANYKRMIEYALQHNVVPVLMTKADALETQQGKAPPDTINQIARRLGAKYGVPVIDFAQGVKPLSGAGLVDEYTIEGKKIEPFHINEAGMDARMLMTLQTLAQIADTANPVPTRTPPRPLKPGAKPPIRIAPKPTALPKK